MTYQEFKANYPIGSSVASPEGTYKGQCVSYVRQYMALVHGVQTGPLGDAVDFATNPTFLGYYEKVATPQVGDIMVWGDDPGTWTGQYGHIAIYDAPGYMMNQNFNGSLKVSRNQIFTPGFIGYFRKKGTDVNDKVTYEWIANASQILLGRPEPVTREWFDKSAEKNMTRAQVYDIWANSEEAKNFRWKGWDYDRMVARLSVSTADAAVYEPVTETLYRKK